MTKKLNHNTPETKIPKFRTSSEAKNYLVHTSFPSKERQREALIAALEEWADDKSSVDLDGFIVSYKIPRQTFYDWVKRYPEIKETWDNVKLAIGLRRRTGALYREFDGNTVWKDMHCYKPTWKEDVDEYWRDMKAKETAQTIAGIQIYQPLTVEDTGKVPPNKKKAIDERRGENNSIEVSTTGLPEDNT